MKRIILGLLLFSSLIQITNAIPIPALIIGTDFLFFLIPVILGLFTTIYFYFKKYLLKINCLLLVTSTILYFVHYYITSELLIINYEYLFFILCLVILFFVNKYKQFFLMNYIIAFSLIGLSAFFTVIDYRILKYKSYITDFGNMIGSEKIDSYLIKDNFFVIYLKEQKKEIIVSNCYEGQGAGELLIRDYAKDSNKKPLGNGYCIYGNFGTNVFEAITKVISN